MCGKYVRVSVCVEQVWIVGRDHTYKERNRGVLNKASVSSDRSWLKPKLLLTQTINQHTYTHVPTAYTVMREGRSEIALVSIVLRKLSLRNLQTHVHKKVLSKHYYLALTISAAAEIQRTCC